MVDGEGATQDGEIEALIWAYCLRYDLILF